VLSEQSVHLAAQQVEVDLVVREHSGEALRDPAEVEERGLSHRSAMLSRSTEAARQLLRGRARPHGEVGRYARVEVAHADRAARGAEHEVFAPAVDAGDR